MIWLVGSRGMLGRDVEQLLREKDANFIATDLDVDVTDLNALHSFSLQKSISWIINCSAYTDVDRAEEERERAFAINALGVHNLAKMAKDLGANLVHISTDYVFDGTKRGYYTEQELSLIHI